MLNHTKRWPAIWLLTAFSMIVLGKICLEMGTIGGTVSPFWLPAGLVVALSLRLGYAVLPGIFLGEFLLCQLFIPGPIWQHLVLAFGNVLEGAAVCYLAPRWMTGNDPLASVKNFFVFFAAASVGSAQNALLGVSTLWFLGIIPLSALPITAFNWSFGDMGGALIVAPLVFALYPMDRNEWRNNKGYEFVILAFLVIATSGAMFGLWHNMTVAPLTFLLLPLLIWGAFRLGAASCTLLNAAMMAVVIWGTTHDRGPFASTNATESLILLQLFTSVMVVTSLLIFIVNKDRQRIMQELALHAAQLEQRVADRTADLQKTFKQLDKAHQTVSSSIQYAARIQHAILPTEVSINHLLRDHFVLWQPRDVVSGDMYWCKPWGEGSLVILGDCTGHGVPGAFMTLVASGALDRAMTSAQPGDVSRLMGDMHQNIQQLLNQDHEHGQSDDGIEVGVCYINQSKTTLCFAGARFDLYVAIGGSVSRIKGCKSAMGYRGIPLDQQYEAQQIDIHPNATYYLASDGIIDQIGEATGRGLGRKQLTQWLSEMAEWPLGKQKDQIIAKFLAYQGTEKRRDDVAVLGFRI